MVAFDLVNARCAATTSLSVVNGGGEETCAAVAGRPLSEMRQQ